MWIVNIEARLADQGSSARHLAAAAEPVFIFDGRMPVLVWANEAALAFFGHAATTSARGHVALPHLDRAMPAMTRLRALAEQDVPASGARLDLVFWTAHGARNLSCDCRRASLAFAQEALIVHGLPAASLEEPAPATAAGAPSLIPAGKTSPTSRTGKPKAACAQTRPGKTNKLKSGKAAIVARETRAPIRAATVVPPASRLEACGDAMALREIARQIQTATQSATLAQAASRPQTAKPPLQPESGAPAHEAQPTRAPAIAQPVSQAAEPDFLSQIGHEIRTPLNSILGFAEIMREERFGPIGNQRYKTYAADIHDSAAHAMSLINDLLDLSRLEAGGMQLEPVEVDVATSIAQAVAALRPSAEKVGVVLAAPTGRPLPRLTCDARALKQMLLNLLSNAIKQTDGGGAVWATAAMGDDGGLVIRVQDTGVGMSADDVAIAMQPYRQVGAAERRAGGTGLGLPLTKAMAEANGGRLNLERIAGGGLAALLIFAPDRVVRDEQSV